jgi:hypothetical protein
LSPAAITRSEVNHRSARARLLLGLAVVVSAISALGLAPRAHAEPVNGGGSGAAGCPYGTDENPSTKPPGWIETIDGNPPITVVCGLDGHWHRVIRNVQPPPPVQPPVLPPVVAPPPGPIRG